MILRRFMQHVKEQNWFAVGLDVVVVIVGIFLGMQMSDWNEGRQEIDEERELLNRLLVDVQSNIKLAKMRLDFFDVVEKDSFLVVNYLSNPKTFEVDPERLATAIYNTSHVSPGVIDATTFEEMSATAKFGLVRNLTLRDAIASYYMTVYGWIRIWNLDINDPLRVSVRQTIPFDVQRAIFQSCEVLSTEYLNELAHDCVHDFNEGEAEYIIERINQNPLFLDKLNYRMGRVNLIKTLVQLYLTSSIELKALIEKNLEQEASS